MFFLECVNAQKLLAQKIFTFSLIRRKSNFGFLFRYSWLHRRQSKEWTGNAG